MVKACWREPLTPKKRKKLGNVGALNFGGAMKQFARGYSSEVEISTADRMVSSSNPQLHGFLGIGVP